MTYKNLQLVKKKNELMELGKKRKGLFESKWYSKEDILVVICVVCFFGILVVAFFLLYYGYYLIMEQFDSSYADKSKTYLFLIIFIPVIIGGLIYFFFTKLFSIANLKRKLERLENRKEKLKREINEIVSRNLIDEGDREFNNGRYFQALESYKTARSLKGINDKTQQKITNRFKKIEKILIDSKKRNFRLFLDKGNELFKKGLWVSAIDQYNRALSVAGEIKTINPLRLKDLKTKIDFSYRKRIDKLMKNVDKMVSQKSFQKAQESLKDILNISRSILNYNNKIQIQENIREKIDLISIKMAVKKINTGKKLKNENKTEKSLKVFGKALNIISEVFNREIRQELEKKIKTLTIN